MLRFSPLGPSEAFFLEGRMLEEIKLREFRKLSTVFGDFILQEGEIKTDLAFLVLHQNLIVGFAVER